jgi:hypothetical protein
MEGLERLAIAQTPLSKQTFPATALRAPTVQTSCSKRPELQLSMAR